MKIINVKLKKAQSAGNRACEMAELKTQGKSFEDIGVKFGLTRQRVQQILLQFFPNEKFKRSNEEKIFKLRCLNCLKEVCASSNRARYFKYCSFQCRSIYRGREVVKLGLPSTSKYASEEQKKLAYRIRTLAFYNRNKDKKWHKLKIKRNNRLNYERNIKKRNIEKKTI